MSVRCKTCRIDVQEKNHEKHLQSRTHIKLALARETSAKTFKCIPCNKTIPIGYYDNHHKSLKHIRAAKCGIPDKTYCEICERSYQQNSYYEHIRGQKHHLNKLKKVSVN